MLGYIFFRFFYLTPMCGALVLGRRVSLFIRHHHLWIDEVLSVR